MKIFYKPQFLLICLFSLWSGLAIANNDLPGESIKAYSLISNSEVVFSVENIEDEDLFINTTFSTKNKSIFLETEAEISFIQILNSAGELEYQLPIASSKLHIDLNDFITGDYDLNILLDGNDEYVVTKIQKTF